MSQNGTVFITRGPQQTQKLGRDLAQKLLQKSLRESAFFLALEGDLGGGKTTFLQGLAAGLGVKQKILSPTFIIIRRHNIKSITPFAFREFYHVDCYRLRRPEDLLGLNFEAISSGPKNFVAVEWADRVKKILPRKTVWIKFKFLDRNSRKITISKLDSTT